MRYFTPKRLNFAVDKHYSLKLGSDLYCCSHCRSIATNRQSIANHTTKVATLRRSRSFCSITIHTSRSQLSSSLSYYSTGKVVAKSNHTVDPIHNSSRCSFSPIVSHNYYPVLSLAATTTTNYIALDLLLDHSIIIDLNNPDSKVIPQMLALSYSQQVLDWLRLLEIVRMH